MHSSGQLGQFPSTLPNTYDGISQTLPIVITGLSGVFVTQVSAGFAHSMVLSSDGEVYAFGLNEYVHYFVQLIIILVSVNLAVD
jgi:alpha-tubulin suppressor-like RCC1 family protein